LVLQLKELREAKLDLFIGDFSHSILNETFKQITSTVIFDHCLEWRTPFQSLFTANILSLKCRNLLLKLKNPPF